MALTKRRAGEDAGRFLSWAINKPILSWIHVQQQAQMLGIAVLR